jgi:hypothetical protein
MERPLPAPGLDNPAMEVAAPPPRLGWTQHSVNAQPARLQFHQRPPLKPHCTWCISCSTTHHLRVLRRPQQNNGAMMLISSSSRPSTCLLLGVIANHQLGTRAHLKHHGHRVPIRSASPIDGVATISGASTVSCTCAYWTAGAGFKHRNR